MTPVVLAQLAGLLLLSFAGASAALFLMSLAEGRFTNRLGRDERSSAETVFLFDESRLVDATRKAADFLKGAGSASTDLDALLNMLSGDYPDLEVVLSSLPETISTELDSLDGSSRLVLEYRDGLSRIAMEQAEATNAREHDGSDPLAAMEEELDTLRMVANSSPFLVWKTGEDGRINWANSAYIRIAQKFAGDDVVTVWPPQVIFSDESDPPLPMDEDRRRSSLKIPGEVDERHFELHSVPVKDGRLYMAVSADRAVRAETALNDFVQTLTKTFAHLTLGLAIFDKQRKLALFNPALGTLTTLKPEFLTARPSLQNFLDRLRDKRMIPEPRDYKSWRQQIYELESAAIEGQYEETWPLPNGQTYRVTGRPHPDGALAFIFEDISAEISLARRYRTEIETGQAVLDSMAEAVAVFGANGTLTLSNTAYARLWGIDPSETVVPMTIVDCTRIWSAACAPSPVWGDLREYVGAFSERAEWSAELRLHDGRGLTCRSVPLGGGSTLIGFSLVSKDRLQLPAPAEKTDVIYADTGSPTEEIA